MVFCMGLFGVQYSCSYKRQYVGMNQNNNVLSVTSNTVFDWYSIQEKHVSTIVLRLMYTIEFQGSNIML